MGVKETIHHRRHKPVAQLPLRNELLKEVYRINSETFIYPEDGQAGKLTEPIEAEIIDGKKVKGLQAFRSLSPLHLFYGRHWQRSARTVFGTWKDKTHKVELKVK